MHKVEGPMSQQEIDQAAFRYETFINDVLREDLRLLEARLQRTNEEILELTQQKRTLKVITDKTLHPDGFKAQVNIGCNFFMEGKVSDTSKMLFDVGLQTFLEFTVDEANKYLDARIKAFETLADELNKRAAGTKARIKLILLGIHELQNADKIVEGLNCSSARDR